MTCCLGSLMPRSKGLESSKLLKCVGATIVPILQRGKQALK